MQKCRGFGPGSWQVWTVSERIGCAFIDNACGGGRIDADGVGVPNSVDVVTGRPASELECADRKGCHLVSSYVVMGTEPGGAGRATLGDPDGGKPVHVGRPPFGGVDVCKSGDLDRFGFIPVQGSHQPHGHHPSLHGTVRTEQRRAALCVAQDALRSDGFDSGRFLARCDVFV